MNIKFLLSLVVGFLPLMIFAIALASAYENEVIGLIISILGLIWGISFLALGMM